MNKPKIIKIDFGKDYIDLDHDIENANWLYEARKTKFKYRGFFINLAERYRESHPKFTKAKVQKRSYFAFGAGRGLKYVWSFVEKKKTAQIELYIDVGDRQGNLRIFNFFKEKRELIEAELSELSWEELGGKRACRVALCRPGTIVKINKLNDEQKKEISDWFMEVTPKFVGVFSMYIDQLPK